VIGLLDRLGLRARGDAAVTEHVAEARELLDRLPFAGVSADEMRALIERLAGRER